MWHVRNFDELLAITNCVLASHQHPVVVKNIRLNIFETYNSFPGEMCVLASPEQRYYGFGQDQVATGSHQVWGGKYCKEIKWVLVSYVSL